MTILFEDAQLLVCVKPAGILSQAAQNGGESMITLLEAHTGGAVFPVHRLDRAVGGVMVYAKTKEAAAALSKQVADRAMQKAYRALVHGVIEPPAGVMEDLLFKDSRTNKVFVVKRERKGVKPARLSYETLEVREPSADDRSCPLSFAALSSAPDPFHHGLRPRSPFPKGDDRGASRGITCDTIGFRSLVSIQLDTGRTHQIRVQFASRKHPLVGDARYGAKDGAKELHLWSYRLTFFHPKTGEAMTFTQEAPF